MIGQSTSVEQSPLAADFPLLAPVARSEARLGREIAGALADARAFRREVVESNALAVDLRAGEDPAYVAEAVLGEAARRRLIGALVPRAFGGAGLGLAAFMLSLEEISAGCVGIANLLAVHGLALSTIAATGNVLAMDKVCCAITRGEQRGEACLLATALTEPSAGTDIEDAELLERVTLQSAARPVPGGWLLSGRKVFISNGSLAAFVVVVLPSDPQRPVDTLRAFLVEAATPGFSVARVERKMGQKACPAAELVFEDCFVPHTALLGSDSIAGRRLDLVLGATRGGVAVFAAGVARGALERAVAHARRERWRGQPLIEQQWVQLRLAHMLGNLQAARHAYVSAMFSNELFGLARFMTGGPLAWAARWLPAPVSDRGWMRQIALSTPARDAYDRAIATLPDANVAHASLYGSAAKVAASELAFESCELALEIAGASGLRHDRGLEKLYRDAKLLEIYEGTNQLNRLEMFKKGIRDAFG